MKKLLALVLAISLGLVLSLGAFADTGPKPSVRIRLKNLPDGRVYGTLLSEKESTGPYSYDPGFTPQEWYEVTDAEIWRAFQSYEDPDGFYFLNELWDCSDGSLDWTYYPPNTFKLLLYFPDTGEWLSSDVCGSYAFASYFTVDLSAEGGLALERSYDYGGEILGLIGRIAVTLLIEGLIALIFGYRARRVLALIVLVNLATQAALNIALNLAAYFYGRWLLLVIVGELAVTFVEAVVYRRELPRRGAGSPSEAVSYAILANLASAMAGLALL